MSFFFFTLLTFIFFYFFLWVCILSIIRFSSCDLTILRITNLISFDIVSWRLGHVLLMKPLRLWVVMFFDSLTFDILRLQSLFIIHLMLLLFFVFILPFFELRLVHHQLMTFHVIALTCLILEWISSCNHGLDLLNFCTSRLRHFMLA